VNPWIVLMNIMLAAWIAGQVLAHVLYRTPLRPMLKLWFRLPDHVRHDAAVGMLRSRGML
jgi:hypothetical protein